MSNGFIISPQQRQHIDKFGRDQDVSQFVLRVDRSYGNVDRIKHAIGKCISENDILRTKYEYTKESKYPRQFISDVSSIFWFERYEKFDLNRESLNVELGVDRDIWKKGGSNGEVMFSLIAGEYIVATINSLNMDLRSVSLIVDYINGELTTKNTEEQEPIEKIQYVDLSSWYGDILSDEDSESAHLYWKNKCNENELQLPYLGDIGVAIEHREYKQKSRSISAHEYSRLEELSGINEVRNGDVLLTLWQILLFLYSENTRPIVGLYCNGRDQDVLDKTIGMIEKTIPIGIDIRLRDSVFEIARRNANSVSEVHEYQDYFDFTAASGSNKKIDKLIAFQYEEKKIYSCGKDAVSLIDKSFRGEDQVIKLTFVTNDHDGAARIEMEYDTSCVSEYFCNEFINKYYHLVEMLLEDPDCIVEDLKISSPFELDHADSMSNGRGRTEKFSSISQKIDDRVNKFGQSVALETESTTLTYMQFSQRVNQISNTLIERGIKKGDCIAVIKSRSTEAVCAFIAIIKIGGIYLPIDENYPDERIKYMLDKSGAKIIVFSKNEDNETPSYFQGCDSVSLDECNANNKATDFREVGPDDGAYMVFTSGTTGYPKAVLISQSAILEHIVNVTTEYKITCNDRYLLFSTLTFDPSIEQILVPLLSGATLFIREKEVWDSQTLKTKIEKHNISVVNIPTAFWNQVVGDWSTVSSLPNSDSFRLMVVGGEKMAKDKATKWLYLASKKVELINAYGPTEATITAMTHYVSECSFAFDDHIPIGRPLRGRNAHILSESGAVQPIGKTGELYLSGAGLAMGYVDRTDKNDNFSVVEYKESLPESIKKIRLYKTGDIAYRREDGQIVCLGRQDDQVKVNGYRIELSEIEFVANKYNLVSSAVALTRDAGSGLSEIVLFVSCRDECQESDLRWHLSEQLPEYMVPAKVIVVDRIPLTRNGKVDKNKLLDNLKANSNQILVTRNTSMSEVEKQLAEIWERLFESNGINRDSSFFGLGGHSLLAMKMSSYIEDKFGTRVSIDKIYKEETLANIANLLEIKIESVGMEVRHPIPITNCKKFPLSYMQDNMWVLMGLGESKKYNMPGIIRIKGNLCEKSLEESLRKTIEDHDVLRTHIEENEQGCVQLRTDNSPFSIEHIVLKNRSLDEASPIIDEWKDREFDFAKGPYFRALLLKLDNNDYIFGVCLHHIIADGWTVKILLGDISKYYFHCKNRLVIENREVKIGYLDYSLWQKKNTSVTDISKSLDFWESELEGYCDIDFISDYSSRNAQSMRGGRLSFEFDNNLMLKIKKICGDNKITFYHLFLSIVYLQLKRLTGQSDFCIGIPLLNRDRVELTKIAGLFVNTVPLRVIPNDERVSVLSFVQYVKDKIVDITDHQNIPFNDIVKKVNPKRDSSRNPIFQVVVNNQIGGNKLELDGCETASIDVPNNEPKFDMEFNLVQLNDNHAGFDIEYNADILSCSTIEFVAQRIIDCVEGLTEKDQLKTSDLLKLSSKEAEDLQDMEGSIDTDTGNTVLVVDRFKKVVEKYFDHTALSSGKNRYSYAEVDRLSDKVAGYLARRDLKKGQPIGVCFERSCDVVISMLGILKSGCAYVPLDPIYPSERINYIVECTGTKLVLGDKKNGGETERIIDGVPFEDIEQVYSLNYAAPHVVINSRDTAYIIFTSGSTGKPKGANISHLGLANMLESSQHQPGFSDTDKILSITNYCFDISVFDYFLPLVSGGECVIATKSDLSDFSNIVKRIAKVKPTQMFATPSAWQSLFNVGWSNNERVKVLAGGEPIDNKLMKCFDDHGCEVWNIYGPTETTVYCLTKKINGDRIVTVGHPTKNTKISIQQSDGSHCPPYVVGEICVTGHGVSTGYINRDDLNKRNFVDTRFGNQYKTGDLGRWIKINGEYSVQCLGRIDNQIKHSGYRIELEEIENTISEIMGVSQSCVVQVGSGDTSKLVAFYHSKNKIEDAEFAVALSRILPLYMIPKSYIAVESFPLSLNGKLDRELLSKTYLQLKKPSIEKSSTLLGDCSLADIWREVLNIEGVSRGDCFFALGGHSLSMTNLFNKVKKQYSTGVELRDLFNNSRYEDMLQIIIEKPESQTLQGSSVFQDTGNTVAPVSFAQRRLWIESQVNQSKTHFNSYAALKLTGDIDIQKLISSLGVIEKLHEVLRTIYKVENSKIFQHIVPYEPRTFDVVRVSDSVDIPAEKIVSEVIGREKTRIFDLDHGPVWNAVIIQESDNEVVLVTNFHHICIDGWSMRLLVRDLCDAYSGKLSISDLSGSRKAARYIDYSSWQNCIENRYDDGIGYWENKLDGFESGLFDSLVTRYNLKNEPFIGVNNMEYSGSKKVLIHKLAADFSTTNFIILKSIFTLSLSFISGKYDLVVGTDVANREVDEVKDTVGFFVNQIPIRTIISDEIDLSEYMFSARDNILEDLNHQNVPYDILVSKLRKSNDEVKSLFDAKFYLDHSHYEECDIDGVDITPIDIAPTAVRSKLSMGMTEFVDRISGQISYDGRYINEKYVADLKRMMDIVLDGLAANMNESIKVYRESSVKLLRGLDRNDSQELIDRMSDYFSGKNNRIKFNDVRYERVGNCRFSCVSSEDNEGDVLDWIESNETEWLNRFNNDGAIVFRGFSEPDAEQFERISRHVIGPLVNDNMEHIAINSTGNIQTPVSYSNESKLLWHNENSFSLEWPQKIMFLCKSPSILGGQTPLVDARDVYSLLDEEMVDKFVREGVLYVRCYDRDDGFGLGWSTVFDTTDRNTVEKKCVDNNMLFEWHANDRLRTLALRSPVQLHGGNLEKCWVAQILHWHISCLDKSTQESLKTLYSDKMLPRNVYFGSGDIIPESFVNELRGIYSSEEQVFDWKKGDILLVDNVAMSHARNAYKGERLLWVSMGDNLVDKIR